MTLAFQPEDREMRIALISVLQELTIAAMDSFPPGSSFDSFFERIAEKLGCSTVLCLEYLSGSGSFRLLGDSGLSHTSRKLDLPTAPENLRDAALMRRELTESRAILPFPEVKNKDQICWCYQLAETEAWGPDRFIFVLVCFAKNHSPDRRYYGVIERALHCFKAALLHREMYAEMAIQNRRNTLLSEIGKELQGAAFNVERMQKTLAELLVPEVADCSIICEYQINEKIGRVAVGHRNPSFAAKVHEKLESGADFIAPEDLKSIFQNDLPKLNPVLSESSSLHVLLDETEATSVMIAPMRTHDRLLGFICFLASSSRDPYDLSDLTFAMSVASRASLALENARLYLEAQQAIREREAFLAIASHELRTPVTSVRAIAQLLIKTIRSGGSLSSRQIQHLAKLLDEQSIRLTRLVGQLLDVTQIRLGKLTLAPKAVDLVPLVQGIVDAARAKNPAVDFVVRAPEQLLAVVDSIRLEQVIVNLIENSVRHAYEGKRIEIEVLQERDREFSISVRDFGRGIPESQRKKLFQRGASSGRTSGLGLGLYISKQIAEMHGGTIHLENPPGGGVRFVFTGPLKEAPAQNRLAA